ncbi:hypothetical protein BH10BAC2_BH10BAC2_04060 [soil metagenome]
MKFSFFLIIPLFISITSFSQTTTFRFKSDSLRIVLKDQTGEFIDVGGWQKFLSVVVIDKSTNKINFLTDIVRYVDIIKTHNEYKDKNGFTWLIWNCVDDEAEICKVRLVYDPNETSKNISAYLYIDYTDHTKQFQLKLDSVN